MDRFRVQLDFKSTGLANRTYSSICYRPGVEAADVAGAFAMVPRATRAAAQAVAARRFAEATAAVRALVERFDIEPYSDFSFK